MSRSRIVDHYGREGLARSLVQDLIEAGFDVEALTRDALVRVDEFHLGGRAATRWVLADLALPPGARALDVGCGIGGPARTLAREGGLHVTGIDLTPSYVEAASELSLRSGDEARTSFVQGSALDLPFDDGSFDGITMLHVGMNIDDKPRLFSELARVARPGARLVVYDIVRKGDGELTYPLPWSSVPETSFVESPDVYLEALDQAGLRVVQVLDRTEQMLELRLEPSAVDLSSLMGAQFPTMFQHLGAHIRAGVLATVQFVAERPAR